MNPNRKRKLFVLLFFTFILTLIVSLVLYALRQNINLFFSPSQIVKGEVKNDRIIRVGGMVVKGSVHRDKQNLNVEFKLTDFDETVTVRYKGILPDLFREGQGIIALGKMNTTYFEAQEVLAKHDANYMPKEIKDSLAQRNRQEIANVR